MGLLDRFRPKKQEKEPSKVEAKDKASSSLDKNLKYLKDKLKDCNDVVYRSSGWETVSSSALPWFM